MNGLSTPDVKGTVKHTLSLCMADNNSPISKCSTHTDNFEQNSSRLVQYEKYLKRSSLTYATFSETFREIVLFFIKKYHRMWHGSTPDLND